MTLYYHINEIERRYGKEEVRRALNDGIDTYDGRKGDIVGHLSDICKRHYERMKRTEKSQINR